MFQLRQPTWLEFESDESDESQFGSEDEPDALPSTSTSSSSNSSFNINTPTTTLGPGETKTTWFTVPRRENCICFHDSNNEKRKRFKWIPSKQLAMMDMEKGYQVHETSSTSEQKQDITMINNRKKLSESLWSKLTSTFVVLCLSPVTGVHARCIDQLHEYGLCRLAILYNNPTIDYLSEKTINQYKSHQQVLLTVAHASSVDVPSICILEDTFCLKSKLERSASAEEVPLIHISSPSVTAHRASVKTKYQVSNLSLNLNLNSKLQEIVHCFTSFSNNEWDMFILGSRFAVAGWPALSRLKYKKLDAFRAFCSCNQGGYIVNRVYINRALSLMEKETNNTDVDIDNRTIDWLGVRTNSKQIVISPAILNTINIHEVCSSICNQLIDKTYTTKSIFEKYRTNKNQDNYYNDSFEPLFPTTTTTTQNNTACFSLTHDDENNENKNNSNHSENENNFTKEYINFNLVRWCVQKIGDLIVTVAEIYPNTYETIVFIIIPLLFLVLMLNFIYKFFN
jgi:hypothetical protein